MNVTLFIVRVDTKAGFRKNYSFDTLEEANSFIIGCEDKVVSSPIRTVLTSEEEDD